ncbi:angiotensin-converting enzyme-like [Scylla paramamosain]|uniref:angiotensin-converting enzyme-like n=1 Tax=Scylla paramamosain TaxID=85552 RepID=UPI0030839FFF
MRGHTRGPCLALLGLALLVSPLHALITDEVEAQEFMKELDVRFNHECNKEMVARWEYITDVTDPDKETAANAAAVHYLNFKGEAAVNSSQYAYDGFTDVELYRRFRFLSKKGPGALDEDELTEYKALQANMETIYSTATICDFYNPQQCDLILEPDIEAIMASSTNWDELKYVWEQWRDNTGKLMRNDFVRFVELSNKAATLDGFDNTGSYWLNGYTVDQREADVYTGGHTLNPVEFREMLSSVWDQVSEGLYKKLHAYVRMRLQEVYPGKIDPTGPIPSHILGNMWAQTWGNIGRYVMPFSDVPSFDVTDKMHENGWDIMKMFKTAEDFFESIGLYPMTQVFWDRSVINQTAWGKTIVCHASAEDFCLGPEGDDYRIKMCTEVNMEDLITVHHEMGHIEYFMAYKDLPHVFRDSANPGFHEAIGDLIALSVSTPKHLQNILGLTRKTSTSTKYTDEEKQDLNFLMEMALEKIAFLPFGYLIDKYRWGVFDNSITTEELNAGWWNLRESLQGVTTPEGVRGEEFFDPGAKYHVPANVPYIRYFVSFIVQFQFHERLCAAAGHTGPLHTCDIYGNQDAGTILREALKKGFSEPWPVVLKELGGSENIDPQAIIKYFDPLIKFLDLALAEGDQCIGWGENCIKVGADSKIETPEPPNPPPEATNPPTETTNPPSETITPPSENTTDLQSTASETESSMSTVESTTEPSSRNEEQALEDMNAMDAELTLLVQNATLYDWEYYTNESDATAADANAAWAKVSHAFREWYNRTIAFYEYEEFESENLKRRFRLQKNLGTSALSDNDLKMYSTIVKNMTSIYNEGRVVDMNNETISYGIDELEIMMAQTRDADELKHYWMEWRSQSGKLMRDNFEKYITLLNTAAQENDFSDAGEMWVDVYTEPTLNYTSQDFKSEIESLWKELEEFYEELHAYVHYKLKEQYGDDVVDSKFIPAHLLGNMWAQSWENIYDLVAPYPEVPIPDISEALEENIVNNDEMVRIAEDFFTSLGLYNMTQDFNDKSVFEQNEQESVICHASAWDFYDVVDDPSEGDFRIKMCADKNQEDFIVIHHEMGHTEYQMSYSIPKGERPLVFRDGANPGFHEAIGDTIALSVSTPSHLKMIEDYLTNNATNATDELNRIPYASFFESQLDYGNDTSDHKQNINFLMKTALAKIAFLPYAYILDQWRWELFEDNNEHEDYNRKWWELRLDVQGICPPDLRHPNDDLDAGSKYHVADSVPYIRYFVAHILQFQFHHRLCEIAYGDQFEETKVFNCDIYNCTDAGAELKKLLNMGASVEWHEQLKNFMGSSDGSMNSTAILQYFSPLRHYLKEYIKNNKIDVGWDKGKVDDYMIESAYIPATVPIVVGVVLAAMVLIVIIAYFVGQARQKKKEKKAASNSTPENIEISIQNTETKSTGSVDSN